MIYISASFPKSASSLLFLYTEKMLLVSGMRTGQSFFRNYYKEGFVPRIGIVNGVFFLFVSLFFGNIVIKTHGGYNYVTRLLIAMGLAKGFYIYRDPRDVILSALDHGVNARTKEHKTPADRAFERCTNKEQLYPVIKKYYLYYRQWTSSGTNKVITYSDLLTVPVETLEELSRFLKLSIAISQLQELITGFNNKKVELKNFNKGKLYRFNEEMTQEEVEAVEKNVGDCIQEMGFKLISQS